MLDLDHGPLARAIGVVQTFGDHTVEAEDAIAAYEEPAEPEHRAD